MGSTAAGWRGGTGGGASTCGVGSRSYKVRAGAPGPEDLPCASSAPGRPDNVIYGLTGRVITRRGTAGYYGARRATNQTAELTALLRALQRTALRAEESETAEIIHTDSIYAMYIAKGIWKPKKGRNGELARRVRRAWEVARRNRGAEMVELRHVRGHQGIMGNEVADRLADMGKSEYGEREVTATAREIALELTPTVR